MTYNDIGALSISEINNIYNEAKMDMFMSESGYFLDIMGQRSFGALNESVIQESFKEKAAYIWNGIKNFFKTIKDAIKKFFQTIIDAITRSFDNQKVDSKSEKLIEVEDKKDTQAVATSADQSAKMLDDSLVKVKVIRKEVNKLVDDNKKLKAEVEKNKSNSQSTSASDLVKILTSGEKKEDKKSNEPNFTMKDGKPASPSKELRGEMFRKEMDIAKKQTPLMIEKKSNPFDYMKKKFEFAVNWITKEYKGSEEKKFGTLSYWQNQDSTMIRRFDDILNNGVKRDLKLLDSLDYKYDMQTKIDSEDSNKSEEIQAKFKKKFDSAKKKLYDIRNDIENESYYVEMFFGESNKGKSFDEAFRYFFGLDNNVDITTKNLANAAKDIEICIFDKNKYIKMTKGLYNSAIKIINEYESRAKKIKEIMDSGIEFYNYIGKATIDTYLKMVSNFTKYVTKSNSKIQAQIKYNRTRAYEIFNNVIAFANSKKKEWDDETSPMAKYFISQLHDIRNK